MQALEIMAFARLVRWLAPLVLFATSSTALAQKGAAEREARAHYDKGMTLYDAGDFAKAIEEFRTAYEIVPTPGLLFNLGQAYRLEKNYDMALYFYRTYLSRMSDAPNRSDVERRIAEMEELLKNQPPKKEAPQPESTPAQAVTTPPPPAPVIAAPTPAPATPADDEHSGRTRRLTGLAVAGVGVALVATGVAYGVAASSANDDLEAQVRQRGSWSPQLASQYQDGQSDALRANVLLAAGGAAIVTGGIFYYLGWRDAESARHLSVSPTRGGVAMTLSCAF
jgi:tetratricopeptide (TPR) repeat protein